MAVFAHFFSSCCPDLGCIGLWGHEQAVQQGNHLSCHAVCNVPADERPHRIRPATTQRQWHHSLQNHTMKRNIRCQQDRHKNKEKGSVSSFFRTARLCLGALQILVERKAECRLKGFTWRARNSSPCKWKFVQSSFCPQWTNHWCSLDWQSLWVAPRSLSAQIVPTWLPF